ncbi:sulfur oxidation c-type cytochrome SoxX [Meiothermus granaticius]|uniref:Sulfur oxidation c-type cytochrome SoxX n=1 Tax=Meiothermus granaticius NBRC 107808 TaxID=1227551 RepID=A0A399F482_9DEIN|nr:sulfur oxidation c-type cytochrome SoxX [Meiothermus granaticius]MCL6526167.1 sulfur oxidation c-type cytochrome SoxX [Thermaceae bacterium]RIH91504.1 sulfur oxidation c-type cytochrome SoxX [Meiothermus granaticius NBRC 107808]
MMRPRLKQAGWIAALALLGLASSQSDPLKAAVATGGAQYAQVILDQDEGQRLCTQYQSQLPGELIPKFIEAQKALIRYPANGKLLGDWQNGEKVFTDPKRGNCYACHQGDPKQLAYGTMGPSLANYGARGTSEPILRYTYEKIYNSWAFVPCSLMYRGGVHGLFTPEETADLVAFLVDANSPLNRR